MRFIGFTETSQPYQPETRRVVALQRWIPTTKAFARVVGMFCACWVLQQWSTELHWHVGMSNIVWSKRSKRCMTYQTLPRICHIEWSCVNTFMTDVNIRGLDHRELRLGDLPGTEMKCFARLLDVISLRVWDRSDRVLWHLWLWPVAGWHRAAWRSLWRWAMTSWDQLGPGPHGHSLLAGSACVPAAGAPFCRCSLQTQRDTGTEWWSPQYATVQHCST